KLSMVREKNLASLAEVAEPAKGCKGGPLRKLEIVAIFVDDRTSAKIREKTRHELAADRVIRQAGGERGPGRGVGRLQLFGGELGGGDAEAPGNVGNVGAAFPVPRANDREHPVTPRQYRRKIEKGNGLAHRAGKRTVRAARLHLIKEEVEVGGDETRIGHPA